jgi:hypothetical protein
LATGGGGCGCRTSPRPAHDYRSFALLAAALGSIANRRARRRRALGSAAARQ